MESAVETTGAQHLWNVALFIQVSACERKITFEIQHGDDGCGHHFRVTHLTLAIFIMV
jgi:hypothetical protein